MPVPVSSHLWQRGGTNLCKQRPTEKTRRGRSVHHALIVEKYREERVILPVNQWEAPVFEILPGPVLGNQGVNVTVEEFHLPFGVLFEPLNIPRGTQETSSNRVVEPSPNLQRLGEGDVDIGGSNLSHDWTISVGIW